MAALALAGLLDALAYWPGLMTWDSVRQYGQALSGDFDDWHPPTMEWLWRQLLPLGSGPASMLILQLLFYWGGFALLLGWAAKARRARLAVLFVAFACMPMAVALMGAVLKDCLMAGMFVTATALLAWTRGEEGWRRRAIAILLLFAGATLRFNAFLAALPLLAALLPAGWLSTWPRRIATWMLGAALLVAAMPLANSLLRAQTSGVQLSLQIFDLGGITEHSGIDVFPALGVADPVAVNHRCYTPVKWDSYSFWTDAPCPLGFDAVRAWDQAHPGQFARLWIAAIVRHPLAYAAHRLAHFNINTRFLVQDEIERPVQVQSAPNAWGYRVGPNPLLAGIDRTATWSVGTPLGWPICWLAVGIGIMMLAPQLPSRRLVAPLAGSGLLYGFGYLPLSVASELRYHLWTMLSVGIALALSIDDLMRDRRIVRGRLLLAAAPLLATLLLCILARASVQG